MVGHDINRGGWSLQIITPVFESLKYGKELLIMSIIIQLGCGQGLGVKRDQANFTIRAGNGENACNGIIRHVGLNRYGGAGLKVGEDWSRGEGFLQLVKGSLACIREVPGGIFPSQLSQGDHDVRVVKYELTIEIREAEEGLNVLYFLGLRPLGEKKYPRYSMESEWNSHFSGLAKSLCC